MQSFASYQDYNYMNFGALRVINEDRVAPGEGFGKHGHSNQEIWSYIVDGELEHKDSLGNVEIMKRGDIQMTSTGKGVHHSEYNASKTKPVHFLQIWATPWKNGLDVSYYNRHFSEEEKRNKLVEVVAPVDAENVIDERDTKGPAPVHSHVRMHASILTSKETLTHKLRDDTKLAYLHLIMRSGYRKPTVPASDKFEDGGAMLKVNAGLVLEEGDGAFITVAKEGDRSLELQNVAEKDAEFLLWEMSA